MNMFTGTGDQARTLRLMVNSRKEISIADPPSSTGTTGVRVISVTSGKGGVGKSNVTINLAVALANEGKKVLVIDADLGLGNIDVLLGMKPSHTLNDVFSGTKRLSEIIVEGPGGIKLVPAGSGIQTYTSLDRKDRLRLMDELDALEEDFDIVIIDTESGVSENVTYFASAAQEILLVVSPEPTSIADVYALIKVLTTRHNERHYKVLVNMTRNSEEGMAVFKKLAHVVNRFLDVSLDYVGCVVRDDRLLDAVRRQRPVMELFPRSAAAHCFAGLARNMAASPVVQRAKGNIQFLFSKYYDPPQTMRI